jgi:hypothetical protein
MFRIDLHSTSLAAAAYSDRQNLLELRFRSGTAYRYFGVPPEIYGALLRAPSQGAYFNQCIRDRFAYVKIGPEQAIHGCDSTPCPNR